MAEEKEKKSKNNKRIHLTGSKYIIGDSQSYWIVQESHRKGKVVQRRMSGYHTDFCDLLNSYLDHSIRETPIEGEIADLVKAVEKTRREISRWVKRLNKAVEEERKAK